MNLLPSGFEEVSLIESCLYYGGVCIIEVEIV